MQSQFSKPRRQKQYPCFRVETTKHSTNIECDARELCQLLVDMCYTINYRLRLVSKTAASMYLNLCEMTAKRCCDIAKLEDRDIEMHLYNTTPVTTYTYNLAFSTTNEPNPEITSSASCSILFNSSSHVGLSLISPTTPLAVQIP